MASFTDRFRSAWNAFSSVEENGQPAQPAIQTYGGYMGMRPDRPRLRITNERSIISSIYTRMGIDVASVDIRHTRHDDQDRYQSDMDSGLNNCLTVEANMDQAARAFRLDMALSLFDKGVIAIVPVDTTIDPSVSGGYDIRTMRVGEITQWYPNYVRVSLYNEQKGYRQEIVLPKTSVGIVENPLYSVMNEPNSTLQRLIRKLSLLDSVDEATSSGKLDLIIQLPYVVKSDARRQQADERRKDIEYQLKGSQYGIAWTDGTEKITQLNRPTENNLLGQIEYLTNLLYSQLGLTPEVMNGKADEAAMINYINRMVEPVVSAISEEMARKFITKTGRAQGQRVDYFHDPFRLLPLSQLADIVDKLSRNEVMSANEFRGKLGMRPSMDPKADQLINSNMPVNTTGVGVPGSDPNSSTDSQQQATTSTDTSAVDNVNAAISAAFSSLGAKAPTSANLQLPPGGVDPSIITDILDKLDASVDDVFNGLGA